MHLKSNSTYISESLNLDTENRKEDLEKKELHLSKEKKNNIIIANMLCTHVKMYLRNVGPHS